MNNVTLQEWQMLWRSQWCQPTIEQGIWLNQEISQGFWVRVAPGLGVGRIAGRVFL